MLLNQFDSLVNSRYHIIKLLGQGNFGKTFLAVDKQQPASLCVVKQLSLHEPIPYPQASQLFQQEARYLSKLGEHPQIPTLLDTFARDGQVFIVQEWIDGWTLEREAIDAPYNEVEVWSVLRELLPVLQYLHDCQVIHRDIKPANIIRRKVSLPASSPNEKTKQENLVLVDFGAAKYLTPVNRVNTGTLVGSAEYAAPEQIRGQADCTSDLYSLGVTCLHLLTQMSPLELYDSSEDCSIWQEYLTTSISPSLKKVLCRLIEPVVRRRYRSAAEVLGDLETLFAQSDNSLRRSQQIVVSNYKTQTISEKFCSVKQTSLEDRYKENFQTWYRLKPETETSGFARNIASFLTSRLAATTTQPNQRTVFSTKSCKSSSRSRNSFITKFQIYSSNWSNSEARDTANLVFFFFLGFILTCFGFMGLIIFVSTMEQKFNTPKIEMQNWRLQNTYYASSKFNTLNSSKQE